MRRSAVSGSLPRGQDLHEEAVRLGIGAEIAVDQLQRLGDEAERVRVDVEPVLVGGVEQAEEIHRIVAEGAVVRDVEPVRIDREARDVALPEAPAAPREQRLALLFALEERAEDARQIADVLGDQEIVLHEALDAARSGMVGVAHAPADFALQVEGEAVLAAAGEEMQVAAHRPQEILRALETLRLVGIEHLALDEIGHVVDAIDVFRDPEKRVEIAQAALALLHVGLDEVARIAEPRVALVALVEFCLEELRAPSPSSPRTRSAASDRDKDPGRPTHSALRARRCGS